jgi:hypothetical protein
MAIPTDMFYFAGSYLAVLLGGFFLLNWLSAGVLRYFLRVKSSRGRLLLVIVHTKLRTYTTTGGLEGQDLVYFDKESKANKQKTPKRINNADRSCFYRFMGLWACNVDEGTNNLIKPDGSIEKGFDPIRWNNLYLRALMKPTPEDKDKIFLIIIAVVVIIVLFVTIFLAIKVSGLTALINGLKAVGGSTVAGVNV